MEVAPSAVGIGESIGIGKTLTAGILPPYDFTRLSFARKTDGSDRTSKAGLADRPAPIERKVDTLEMRNSFVKTKETSGEWTKLHKKVDGRPTWRNGDKTQYYQKTVEKSEIEVYDKHGEHVGVIKPSDGELRTDLKVDGRSIDIK